MAQKKQADPQKKLLITAIKKTVVTNSVLPILENIYFDGENGTVTDLETNVIVPFKTGINACVPAKKVIDILEMMDAPAWAVAEGFGVEATEGSRKVKVTGDNPDNFLKVPLLDKEYPVIGRLNEADLGLLKEAVSFVSKDDLRPAMTGVFISREIVATNAHRMFWKKMSNKVKADFILPKKTVIILLAFGGDWEMTSDWKPKDKAVTHVCFSRADGVKVVCRVIDAPFPKYKVVIPEGDGVCQLIIAPGTLLKELKNASKFANKSTNLVKFHMNGRLTISSCDVDFGTEYKNEVNAEFKWGAVTQTEMDIAFNGNFLSEIISKQPEAPVTIKLYGPTKAAIINDNYLLMSLMQNQ
jgi:DNA polymerase-3 subunit beta